MKFDMKTDHDSGVLRLEGDLTIQHASALKGILLQSQENVTRLDLVLGKGAMLDLSTLQLFCSAHRTAVGQNKILVVRPEDPKTVAGLVRDTGYKRGKSCRLSGGRPCLWTGEGPDL
jgi:anti-anti-sigma regulatory factor